MFYLLWYISLFTNGMSEWERKERVRPEANILSDFFRKANKGERDQEWAKLSIIYLLSASY